MASRLRQAVAPLFLLLCLLLGGSAQGIWANMVLQLLGVAILAWAAVAPADEPLLPAVRQLLILFTIAIAWIALQLVPLPASIWPHLGGRGFVAEGYRVLGVPLPPQPISLAPYKSLDSLLSLIPPLALFCAIVRLKAYNALWLAAALLTGAIAGVVLGALQVASSDYLSSPWYLYPEVNFGMATGFFANANHMAILLVVTLPFLAAIARSVRGAGKEGNSAVMIFVAAIAMVVVVGIAIDRSLAGYGLALPVVVTSTLLILPSRSRLRILAFPLACLLLIGALGAIGVSSTRPDRAGQDAANSVTSRQEMLVTTSRALKDFMPWGSGLGSFRGVYQLYESRAGLTDEYVIHAHDDYAELALELGVPGVLLIIAFLAWWARAAWRAWRDADGTAYARTASIASAAILAHSLVDFPLRTAAISTVFAMCLALLLERRPPAPREKAELRPTRHVVLR